MRFDSILGWLALAGLTGCAARPTPLPVVRPLAPEQIAVRVYLIGDAGAPARGGDPVLEALGRELKGNAGEQVVVYLGDNIYPRGLPLPGRPSRPEAERRLASQVEVVTGSRARGYFVPGNHDWKGEGGDGWAALTRQERFIDSAGAGRVALKPTAGCAGPATIDVGPRLRLVLLDSNWWLRGQQRLTTGCAADTEPEIIGSIRQALRTAGGRLVIVAAHHPLSTGGEHGGYFGWKDHIFPLRAVDPDLWIPLPLLGSLYPAARQHGISNQDIPSPAYQQLISALRRAFSGAPPALYAAGHEHNLQVIAGGLARLELVSGSGIYGHDGRAVRVEGSLFAREASGYARLDIPWQGGSRLAVVEVNASGMSREVFSTQVE